MIHSHKPAIVPKHHNLIPRIPRPFRILPLIHSDFSRLRAIPPRHVEHATPWQVAPASAAQLRTADAARAIDVWVRRGRADGEPCAAAAAVLGARKGEGEEGH